MQSQAGDGGQRAPDSHVCDWQRGCFKKGMRTESKPAMTPEKAAEYRKAIAPLQEFFSAMRAARLQIFAGGRGKTPSPNPIPLLPGGEN